MGLGIQLQEAGGRKGRTSRRWRWVAGIAGLWCVILLLAYLFAPRERVAVMGRVSDEAGKPLAGITVRARPQPFWVPWSDNPRSPGDPREFTAKTDQAGCYRLKGLSAKPFRANGPGAGALLGQLLAMFFPGRLHAYPQEYELVVDAMGFAIPTRQISTDRGTLRGVDFFLRPDGILAGRTLDTAGRPLAWRSLNLVSADPPRQPRPHQRNVIPSCPATDAKGAFRFERVPVGEYRLEMAVYPELAWEVVQSATNGQFRVASGTELVTRDFFFEAPEVRGGLAGSVVDSESGNPVEAFSIKLTHTNAPGPGSPIQGCVRVDGKRVPLTPSRPAAGQEGRFYIEDLSPGTVALEITAEGYLPRITVTPVGSGRTAEVTISLQRKSGYLP